MFRLNVIAKIEGQLPNAERILVRRGSETLDLLGRELKTDLQTRMRRFTGESQRGIRVVVAGRGLNKTVEVFGELIQHFIDEYGLPPGIFPPWSIGSRVYQYAERMVKKGAPAGRIQIARSERVISHVRSRRPSQARRSRRQAGIIDEGRFETRSGARKAHRQRVSEGRKVSGRSHRSATRDKEVRRVAFLIARGIYEHGITANRPFARTLEANRDRIIKGLQQCFFDAVAEING